VIRYWGVFALAVLAGCVSNTKPNNEALGAVYLQLSRQYLSQGNIAQAKRKSDRAMQTLPNNADAWYMRGLILQQTGQLDTASLAFSKALALQPKHYASQNAYAALLCTQGKVAEGRVILQRLSENAEYTTPEYARQNLARCK
jgi:Tfp pilus assembly protein PilF